MQTRSNKTTRGNRRKSLPPAPSSRKRATSTADAAKAQKKTRLDDSNNGNDEAATEGRISGKKVKKGKARLVTTTHPLITVLINSCFFTGRLRLLGLMQMLLPQYPPTLHGVFFFSFNIFLIFFLIITIYSTEEILDNSGISVAPPKRSRSITTATTMPPRATVTSSRVRRSDAKPMTLQEATGDVKGVDDDDEDDEDKEGNEEEDEENDDDDSEEEDQDNDEEDKEVPEDKDDTTNTTNTSSESGKYLVM
jgi:hypothetical protein